MYTFYTFTITNTNGNPSYTLDPASPHKPEDFKPLIPENLLPTLQGIDPYDIPATIIGVGVYFNGTPVGLSLGTYSEEASELDIHLFTLHPEHQNIPTGTELLAKIHESGKILGARNFYLTYVANTPSTPFFEEIVANNKWSGTRPFMTICNYYMPTLNMPWIHSKLNYLDGFEEFLWSELTPKERRQIERQVEMNVVTSAVDPFLDEKTIEPINSLGLRYQGRVVGWMVTQRLNKETIQYRSLFVEKGLEKYKLGPKLVAHAILRHLESGVLWSNFEIPLNQVSTSWRTFVERHLVPYADEVIRQRLAWDFSE